MKLILDNLRNARTVLWAVQSRSEDQPLMATLDEVTREAIRSGVIQHFARTYELAWKFIRRQLAADIGQTRVDGIARRYSDLDLAVITNAPLSFAVSGALKEDFAESDLPFRVDILDWATTADAFRRIVESHPIIIQTGSPAQVV